MNRKKSSLKCSVGICIYNEEKNLHKLLKSLSKQKTQGVDIDEIVIVDSGSTDMSTSIVKRFMKTNKKIRLIRESLRKGKSSAVNIIIQKARNNILVLLGGDLLLSPDVIQRLVNAFRNKTIGMTGAHPIPINGSKENIVGFAVHLLWELHHRISLTHPKMGEVIAFRRIFKRIPPISGADEASIEPLILGQGYDIKYIPEAIVYNKAPSTVHDFILQRRRNYCLHLAVKYEQRYKVSTLNIIPILKAFISVVAEKFEPQYVLFTPFVVLLEAYSRFLGWWDYHILHKRHTVWDVVASTKNLDGK